MDYDLAQDSIKEGGTWLDVRLADEHAGYAFDNSINVPLSMVRERANSLDPEVKYIICCDTGRRSASAAFLLSQRGFDVCVLEGGMNKSIPAELLDATTDSRGEAVTDKTAAVEAEIPASDAQRTSPGTRNDAVKDLGKLARLQRERDEARKESQAAKNQLAELRQEISDLQTHMTGYIAKAIQLESTVQQQKKAREALTEHIDKLVDQLTSPAKRK